MFSWRAGNTGELFSEFARRNSSIADSVLSKCPSYPRVASCCLVENSFLPLKFHRIFEFLFALSYLGAWRTPWFEYPIVDDKFFGFPDCLSAATGTDCHSRGISDGFP